MVFVIEIKKKNYLPIIVVALLLFRTVGVLFGWVEDAVVVIILLHIVVPSIEGVHNVFSDSALGDDTST